MKKILIVDDDTFICDVLEKHLQNNNYEVDVALNGKKAFNLFKKTTYNLVLCDFRLPDISGLELMQKIKSIDQQTPTVIMTAYADVRTAVKMIKMGVNDYITKPIQHEELISLINDLTSPKNKNNDELVNNSFSFSGEFISGESQQIKEVLKLAMKVAPTNMSVVIDGETGVGKEYIARFIHENSSRKGKPFVAVDSGAIPKDLVNSELFGHVKGSFTDAINDKIGVFEKANSGTLFLDEIGNMSYDVQLKILRAIQERVINRLGDNKPHKIDIRIISATNYDLKHEVENKTFREDLYHRLNEFNISLPPLRERVDDIMIFVEYFIKVANSDLNRNIVGFTSKAEKIILNYPWHGNIRELKNVIKRAVLMAESNEIDPNCLPNEIVHYIGDKHNNSNSIIEDNPESKLKNASYEIERKLIIKTIEESGNNKSKAARLLNIDRKTLYNKLKTYNIDF